MNFQKLSFILIIILTLSACSTIYVPPIPSYQAPKNAKIGVMIDMKELIKHTHFGTTIFNNDFKEYDYSWDMEQAIFNRIKTEIESSSPYQVVDLKTMGYTTTDNLNFTSVVENRTCNVLFINLIFIQFFYSIS